MSRLVTMDQVRDLVFEVTGLQNSLGGKSSNLDQALALKLSMLDDVAVMINSLPAFDPSTATDEEYYERNLAAEEIWEEFFEVLSLDSTIRGALIDEGWMERGGEEDPFPVTPAGLSAPADPPVDPIPRLIPEPDPPEIPPALADPDREIPPADGEKPIPPAEPPPKPVRRGAVQLWLEPHFVPRHKLPRPAPPPPPQPPEGEVITPVRTPGPTTPRTRRREPDLIPGED